MDKLPEPQYDETLNIQYKTKDDLGYGIPKQESTKKYIDEYFDTDFLKKYFENK